MANENDEGWHTSVALVDETVRVTKVFLEDHLEIVEEIGCSVEQAKAQGVGRQIIAKFLNGNWNETRVSYSLERLGLIEEGKLDKEAVESMPNEIAVRKCSQELANR